ncbi:MAG: HAD family hydrolase [Thermoplasmata archaeon]
MIRAVLFDMDGTLLDSEGLSSEATDFGVHAMTGRHLTEEENRSLTGRPVKKVLEEWFPDKSHSIYEAGIGYYRSRLGEISPYPGIKKLLDDLKSKYQMGIVTSTHREQAIEILSKVGLLEYFRFIIGQDDTMMNKPDPEPVLLAMNRLGVSREDCIFVGDQPYDIIAAHEAGIIAAAATWGSGKKDVLELYHPDYFLGRPDELLDLLRTLR